MERMLRPGDHRYDDERSGFQLAWQHRPQVIAAVAHPADVQAAVDLARTKRLAVAVQATGHGLATAAGEDGELVSTRRLNGVRVDPAARTAWVEAGARWEQVIEAAAPYGLAPLSGSAPHVGAVSYTLGGGLGLLARRYGYAADHVRALEVVTADGRLRRCDAETEPDLFWALRGGRDNFGVVTGMEISLLPVDRVYGGTLHFDGRLAGEGGLARAYLEWTAGLPDELTSSMSLIAFPDRYIASVRIVYTGDRAEGERLVEPLRTAGPRLTDQVEELPFSESGSIYRDPVQPHGYYGVHNAMLRDLDAATLAEVVELTGPAAAVPCIMEVRHLGGALSRPPAVPNAVGHRDARYLVRVLSPLPDRNTAGARSVHEKALGVLESLSMGRCLNFVYGLLTTDEVRTGYNPADYDRLAELKRRYDPDNLFRLGHNIPPVLR
jgi:FAD/FMN-containing dehydrogenase